MTTMMDASDEHLLPDLSLMVGIPVEIWMNIFILVSVPSRFSYYFKAADFITIVRKPKRAKRPLWLGLIDAVLLYLIFFTLILFTINLQRDRSGDPLDKLISFFLFGVGVELMFCLLWTCTAMNLSRRRLNINDLSRGAKEDTRNITEPPQYGLVSWRFSWFLLFAGSTCLTNYCVYRRDHNYDYVGPMRLTKLPRLDYMPRVYSSSDQFERLSCLIAGMDDESNRSVEQPNIQATVEIGWGKTWGCSKPEDKDRWNTNWPSLTQCTALICSANATNTCHCFQTEEEARVAAWNCVEREFPTLSRLKSNDTSFAQDQPPWEDPQWPALWRYGKCDHAVGTSDTLEYVQKVKLNGSRQQSFGLVCLIWWALLVMTLLRRRQSSAQGARNGNDNNSHRNLWERLKQIRTSAEGQTVYIGQQAPTKDQELAALLDLEVEEQTGAI